MTEAQEVKNPIYQGCWFCDSRQISLQIFKNFQFYIKEFILWTKKISDGSNPFGHPYTKAQNFKPVWLRMHFFLLIWNSVCRLLIKGQEKTFKQMSNIDKGHLVTFGSSYQNQRRKISSLMRYLLLLLLLLRSFTKNERIKHALRVRNYKIYQKLPIMQILRIYFCLLK